MCISCEMRRCGEKSAIPCSYGERSLATEANLKPYWKAVKLPSQLIRLLSNLSIEVKLVFKLLLKDHKL